ncbi:MAG: hypothetical protein NWF01_10895 [Candidatus Bathyarchaeota archaeon]|nr:hypothetical protein [Candidatus Bathyarchaeota archaeon]
MDNITKLGLSSGILAMMVSFGLFCFIAIIDNAQTVMGTDVSPFINSLYIQSVVGFFAGVIGIIGGLRGKRSGGVLMIIGSILVLVSCGIFGFLPFVIMIAGGIMAVREKTPQPMIRGRRQ